MTAPNAPAKTYPRKTRAPDWLTYAVLIITGFFGIWAVDLIVLTALVAYRAGSPT